MGPYPWNRPLDLYQVAAMEVRENALCRDTPKCAPNLRADTWSAPTKTNYLYDRSSVLIGPIKRAGMPLSPPRKKFSKDLNFRIAGLPLSFCLVLPGPSINPYIALIKWEFPGINTTMGTALPGASIMHDLTPGNRENSPGVINFFIGVALCLKKTQI
jgi:hypothetical protein